MKISYCTSIFPNAQIPDMCKKLKALGYDGVELWDQYLRTVSVEEVEKNICALGLEIAQLCPYFDLTDSTDALEQSYRTAEHYIALARRLHCRNIRVFTGRVTAQDATAEQFAQCVTGLRTICDMAPELYFVLEIHEGTIAESITSTQRLLDAVGRDNLKVNLQLSDHDEYTPYVCAELLGSETVHLHAHNWNDRFENLTYLSDGDYDFEKMLTILAEHGFVGFISIEHGTHYGRHDPLEVAGHEAAYLKNLIEKISQRVHAAAQD